MDDSAYRAGTASRLPLVSFRVGMLIATLMGEPLQYCAYRVLTATCERSAAEQLRDMGASLDYEDDTSEEGEGGPTAPRWIQPIVKLCMERHVVSVHLSRQCSGRLECLGYLPFCKDVVAGELQLTEDDVRQIGRMRGLRTLSMGDGITDAKLRHLANAVDLRVLSLGENKVTGKGFKELTSVPLESVNLSITSVDDEGVAILSEIPTLRRLYVSSDRITQKGVLALGKAVNLQELILECPGATEETVVVLKKLLPKTSITILSEK